MTRTEKQIEFVRVELCDNLVRAVNAADVRGVARYVSELVTEAARIENIYAEENGTRNKSAAELARATVAAASAAASADVDHLTAKRLRRMGR